MGQSVPLSLPGAGGKQVTFTISFPSVHQYSLFQVNDDHGVLLVYASFVLIMTGLLTKLLPPPVPRAASAEAPAADQPRPRWSSDASGEPQTEPDREPASV